MQGTEFVRWVGALVQGMLRMIKTLGLLLAFPALLVLLAGVPILHHTCLKINHLCASASSPLSDCGSQGTDESACCADDASEDGDCCQQNIEVAKPAVDLQAASKIFSPSQSPALLAVWLSLSRAIHSPLVPLARLRAGSGPNASPPDFQVRLCTFLV